MRMACNTCHRELPCDSTGASLAAVKHQEETGHMDYHYVEDLAEQHAADKQYGTTRGTRAKDKVHHPDFSYIDGM